MNEIISDFVLSAAAFVLGWLLSYVVLGVFEFVRNFVSNSVGRVKNYLARRKLKAPNGKRTNLTP